VVSGRVERGVLRRSADAVEIVGLDNEGAEVIVTGIAEFPEGHPGGARRHERGAVCCAG
jgi:elongation factor Tu